MGLDWKPLGRAKAGKEAALDDVVRGLRGLDGPSSTGFLARLFKRRSKADIDRERSQLVERYRELSEPPYATLAAPRVGFDDAANQWILEN